MTQGGLVEYEILDGNDILSNYIILRYSSSTVVKSLEELHLPPNDRLYLGLPSGRLLPTCSGGDDDDDAMTLAEGLSSVMGGGNEGQEDGSSSSGKKSEASKKKKKGGGGKGEFEE